MRVLVYPHSMQIGGSQLNAVELAAAVRDRGHDVLVLSEQGPLVDTVHRLGLEHIGLPESGHRLSPATMRSLARLATERHIDVVHGYEWPPAVALYFGPRLLRGVPAVCTVLSMAVAPFLPKRIPLVVGTEEIRRAALRAGHHDVTLLEPPVDIKANSPDFDGSGFRPSHGLDPAATLVVVVCRLARELKLEGLLSACDTVGALAREGVPVQLAVVGDGPVRDLVAERAARANTTAGRIAVVLTGTLTDPRPAYASADILLGMGGSALRGMAFGKPLIVQGEQGFWRLCTPGTVHQFLRGGWYGIGDGIDSGGRDGAARLRAELAPLLTDHTRRRELGAFGRRLVVQRYSLEHAAGIQTEVYTHAVRNRPPVTAMDTARTAAGVITHGLRGRIQRRRGTAPTDDFNALPKLTPDPPR